MGGFRLGGIRIDRITEMEGPFLGFHEVFPDVQDDAFRPHRRWLQPTALCPTSDKLIFSFHSFLVRTSRHTALIDTCIGCDKSDRWQRHWYKRTDQTWLARLKAARIAPEDVDFVFCTHLHVDHCGWNTRLLDGRWRPTFPNAKYIFSHDAYESARIASESVFCESVEPILETNQAVLVATDFALDDEIWLQPAPGHAPGHVTVHLASNGARAVMCADVLHSPVQCREPNWLTVFDDDAEIARQTRLSLLDRTCDSEITLLTSHFPNPSIGRIVTSGGGYDFIYDSSSILETGD